MPTPETRSRASSTDGPRHPRRGNPGCHRSRDLEERPRNVTEGNPTSMGIVEPGLPRQLLSEAMSYIGKDGDVPVRSMPQAAAVELGEPSITSCPDCGASVRRELLPFRHGRRLLGYFPADVCSNGHEYFTEESGAAIQAVARMRKARAFRREGGTRSSRRARSPRNR